MSAFLQAAVPSVAAPAARAHLLFAHHRHLDRRRAAAAATCLRAATATASRRRVIAAAVFEQIGELAHLGIVRAYTY